MWKAPCVYVDHLSVLGSFMVRYACSAAVWQPNAKVAAPKAAKTPAEK